MAMLHHAARDQDIGNNGWLGVGIFFSMMCSVVSSRRSSQKADVPMSPLPPLQTMPMRWWLHVGMEMAVTCNE